MKQETLNLSSPRKVTIHDMQEEGLNTAILHKTVIVEGIEEFVFRSIYDGRILNG